MNMITNNFNEISNYREELKNRMDSGNVFQKQPQNNQENNEQEFSSVLGQAIDKVDTELASSSNNIPKLISGDLDNIHTAMIDMNKSQLVLQTAVQVRNKCVEAYNEVKNMQF
ncbi:flagellar hook-basal body complex protein FliE [Vagococcus hydrophili]|uniref:Flagellar hook-basal body complex protein FliE n=1 Tax=Vagococcus hydrophili TaxID=2714947 RepID=A0A6G8AWC0_9ENTE|nr:flagellar hook-basal body complex protein FliE [Vagococcus hydrophili]QIL49354.1 flagellar hook-basal body complex protein FliE [Vagococcus hydrophili]